MGYVSYLSIIMPLSPGTMQIHRFTTQLHLFALNNATGGPVGINITQIFGTPV